MNRQLLLSVLLVLLFIFSIPLVTRTQSTTVTTPAPVKPSVVENLKINKSPSQRFTDKGTIWQKRATAYNRQAKFNEARGRADIAASYKKLAELSTAMAAEYQALSLKIDAAKTAPATMPVQKGAAPKL